MEFSPVIEIREFLKILNENFKSIDTCDEHIHYVKFLSYSKDSLDACRCEVYARKIYRDTIYLKNSNLIGSSQGEETE